MCGFSSFTCEMEVINPLFLFLTGSLGELKDICKVLLTKRLLCVSAKFIISNNTINKIEIPPQIPPNILPGRFISITENNSYLLKEDTTYSCGQQSKEIGPLLYQSLDHNTAICQIRDAGKHRVKNNKIKIEYKEEKGVEEEKTSEV